MGLPGFLQHAIDAIKQNENLRGRRKSLKELTSGHSVKMGELGNPEHLQKLIDFRAARRHRFKIISRILLVFVVIILLASLFVLTQDYKGQQFGERDTVFIIRDRYVGLNTIVRNYYYTRDKKAAETRFENGKRHGPSKSYYLSGRIFRSAQYNSDKVISEHFFSEQAYELTPFKTEDLESGVSILWFADSIKNHIIYLHFMEDRIIPNSLKHITFSEYNDKASR